jgi:diketogulonate reductase-like aldo/keto reductase
MQQRAFGRTGVEVAVLGQGTWRMGDGDRRAAVAALRRGLDLGMTHVDTAEMYDGAEAVVGEAIGGRREKVFLVSKVLPSNASRAGVVAACERSLKRLGTEWLDCYLLHWPGRHRLEDTIAGFDRLASDGKIRSWGLSNFDVDGLEEALRIAGPGQIACNQVLYHLAERAIEHAVLPWCAARGVSVVAYSPFGSGDFPAPRSAGGRVLADVAAAHGATARQVALAFLVREAGVFAIPKAGDVAHVEDNAGADGVRLSAEEVEKIAAAFPLGVPGPLPMI